MKKLVCSALRQERAIVTFWFWIVVFIGDFSTLTWYVILLSLQTAMNIFKKEIVFDSKQCIMEQKNFYCAVSKEMP